MWLFALGRVANRMVAWSEIGLWWPPGLSGHTSYAGYPPKKRSVINGYGANDSLFALLRTFLFLSFFHDGLPGGDAPFRPPLFDTVPQHNE